MHLQLALRANNHLKGSLRSVQSRDAGMLQIHSRDDAKAVTPEVMRKNALSTFMNVNSRRVFLNSTSHASCSSRQTNEERTARIPPAKFWIGENLETLGKIEHIHDVRILSWECSRYSQKSAQSIKRTNTYKWISSLTFLKSQC